MSRSVCVSCLGPWTTYIGPKRLKVVTRSINVVYVPQELREQLGRASADIFLNNASFLAGPPQCTPAQCGQDRRVARGETSATSTEGNAHGSCQVPAGSKEFAGLAVLEAGGLQANSPVLQNGWPQDIQCNARLLEQLLCNGLDVRSPELLNVNSGRKEGSPKRKD